jgi:hypothetical protein
MENHTSMDELIPASKGEQRKVSPPNLTDRAAQTRTNSKSNTQNKNLRSKKGFRWNAKKNFGFGLFKL